MRFTNWRFLLIPPILTLCLATFSSDLGHTGEGRQQAATPGIPASGTAAATDYHLPMVLNTSTAGVPGGGVQQVNAPYLPQGINAETGAINQTAIFWFGQVDLTGNYADVRVGYTDQELYVHVAIFDRLVWYDKTRTGPDLTAWDAASLFIHMDGNGGNAPTSKSYRFVGQVRNVSNTMEDYQAAYQGNGVSWSPAGIPFTTDAFWRGGPNDEVDDGGWRITYRIPFTSLGLAGPPAQGSLWRLGMAVYDRDDAGGTSIPDREWPTGLHPDKPGTWGRLRFGVPSYSPPAAAPTGSLQIRQGLNGAVVPDGTVGGGTNCGHTLERFTEWGEANYAHEKGFNVQNQYDVVDFPCFSKYFVTFDLDPIPEGKTILAAELTIYQFSNAGLGIVDPGPDSIIQVLTIGEEWDEETLTWNNAPQALENVSQAEVPWMGTSGAPYGVPRTWDVLRAAAEAYAAGAPLRLALYSADAPQHTGKYFWSSDYGVAESRPFLLISWGE
jgi:hypothetical protein